MGRRVRAAAGDNEQAVRHGSEGIDWLGVVPVRAAEWSETDGRIVIERPRPTERGLRRLFGWLSYYSAARRLRLDDLGAFVWDRIDGATTLGAIAEFLRDEFGESVGTAEERVIVFVKMLYRERLVELTIHEGG